VHKPTFLLFPIGLLGSLFACSSHQVNTGIVYSDCPQPKLASRIDVRSETSTSGITVLVLDGSSNVPLHQAQFAIVNTNLAALTDSTGIARLPKLNPGTYTLRVRALGYKPVTDTLTVPGSGGRFLIVQIPRVILCLVS